MPINFRERLTNLAAKQQQRSKHTRAGAQGASITLQQSDTSPTSITRELVNVSSNDYLGLANHPRLIAAATTAMGQFGNGAGASRLLTGNYALLDDLETRVAQWLGYDDALWFSSGYLANIGVIPALADANDHIFSDDLNHASTIDGCRLSKARLHIYPHGDMQALAKLLTTCPNTGQKIILSETVFSMDGDVAPVATLRHLADTHDAFLMLDEAHALGYAGPNGTGIARQLGITADALIGTFGKALGSQGAFVAASHDCIQWLWNRARAHMFVTAPHPAVVGSALAAIDLVCGPEGQARRDALAHHMGTFGAASAIVPWLLGSEQAALAMTEQLARAGYWAQAVRPPTVPAGTSRLRMVLTAGHTNQQISELLALCQSNGFSRAT